MTPFGWIRTGTDEDPWGTHLTSGRWLTISLIDVEDVKRWAVRLIGRTEPETVFVLTTHSSEADAAQNLTCLLDHLQAYPLDTDVMVTPSEPTGWIDVTDRYRGLTAVHVPTGTVLILSNNFCDDIEDDDRERWTADGENWSIDLEPPVFDGRPMLGQSLVEYLDSDQADAVMRALMTHLGAFRAQP